MEYPLDINVVFAALEKEQIIWVFRNWVH